MTPAASHFGDPDAVFPLLASVHTNYFFLGKSLFVGDAPMNGSINEFRTYNGALNAPTVATSYKDEPDAKVK